MSFWLIVLWTVLSTILGYLKLKSINHCDLLQETYDRFKGCAKLAGIYIYTKPMAVIIDLDLVKAILIKDFHNFTDRMPYKNEKDLLSVHLINVEGSVWKPLRQKFTPTFSSGKMKFMFPTINSLTGELKAAYERSIIESKEQMVDIYYLNGRYTTDVVGTCIFGIECNSLKDPTVEFRQICSKIHGRTNFNIRWFLFKHTYFWLTKFIGHKRYPQFIEDFFRRVTYEAVMEREKLGIKRNDFLNILIELKNTNDDKGKPVLTYDQISAQLFAFFTAGFETSSTNISLVLYELAKHPAIQEKARQEINKVLEKYNNELTYEAMMELTYIDQIITETLRLYPAILYLQRVAINEYAVPGTDITLDKGTSVFIPVRSIHHDPEIYENPSDFNPERFSPEQVAFRHPQSFLGFGDGPRNCIGLRFGRMQNSIGLVTLLKNFKFSPCSQTSDKIKTSNHSVVNIPVDGIKLKVEKL